MSKKSALLTVLALILFMLGDSRAQKSYTAASPDNNTVFTLTTSPRLMFSVAHRGIAVVEQSVIGLEVSGGLVLGVMPEVVDTKTRSVDARINPPVPEKRSVIPDRFNERTITFRGNYGLKIRAYDDGVAYRFFTTMKGEITIDNETLNLTFAPGDSIYFGQETSLLSHSERLYRHLAVSDIQDSLFCVIPTVVVKQNGWCVAVTESDLLDYPGLYLRGYGNGKAALVSKFPPFPLKEDSVNILTVKVSKGADYIAKTRGTREYPWRVFGIAEEDSKLIENDIVYRLGSPCRLEETSWIRPGKVAWDWWNDNNIHGVDFKAGINTKTYQYYIDFASKNKLEYIIFDEGWSKTEDVFSLNPNMDMPGLFEYAKQKNVGIILWVNWKPFNEVLIPALDQFEKWGAKGIKVDFMQRDDQKMVNFYERVAQEAAKRKLLVDFHGSFKPTGLSRTYPNVMTREGVRGLEHSKWSADITPDHDVTIPYTRMFAGAMDFTPGAMRNATKASFRPVWSDPMSQGTRCHQLAMYVVYESPIQMLCDNPVNYERDPVAMEYLSIVPTVWDETRALSGKISDHITVARRKGNDWFVGSMTDWTGRDFSFPLEFLGEGSYELILYEDGINAERHASDYRRTASAVTRSDTLKMHLAAGGGCVAWMRKK